jgi:hypothetical protein
LAPPPWQFGAGLAAIVPAPDGLTLVVRGRHGVKLAVTERLSSIEIGAGLADPVMSPDQFVNWYPEAACARSETLAPGLKRFSPFVPPSQFGAGSYAIEPLLLGAAAEVSSVQERAPKSIETRQPRRLTGTLRGVVDAYFAGRS